MLNRSVASAVAHRWLSLLLLLTPLALSGQGVSNPLRDAVIRSGGKVIVTLRPAAGGAALRERGAPPVAATEMASIANRLATRFRLQERSRADRLGVIVADIDPDQVAALMADPNVAAVEADRLWAPSDLDRGFDPSDRWAAYRDRVDDVPYGVTNVTAPAVWASGNRGEGIKVAAMDSGGDVSHPDLNYVGGYNAMTRTTSGWADDIAPCNGHGTHVAGTIAARDDGSGVVGVAPRSQLYAIKVFENIGGSCLAYTSSQINGLNWAVSQGIRLVNVSIGGSFSFGYDDAIMNAANQGTYLIAAAGNNGGAVLYPGSSQYAVGVAAVDGNNSRASWSDFGPEVDFAAPGVGVNSTMPGGGYGSKSGTSMATPHVVGVSALILAAYPSLTFAQLYQKLRDGALDLESTGFDNNTGYGLVRAANSIGGAPPPPPPPPLTLAVAPTSRNAAVVQGAAAPADQGSVTLTGTNASSTLWSATKRKSWTTLTTGSGTGSGTVAWNRNAAGLAVGTYVDTISVTATGAVGSPGVIYDTLRITAAVVPLTLAVSPISRNVTVLQGGSAPADQAGVTLAGTNSGSTAWSATKRKSWTTLTTGSGTGSGTVAWSRSATGLSVGTYVDTISVTATGVATAAVVYDTMQVTAAVVPVTMVLTPGSRSTTVQVGGTASPDHSGVVLSGTNSSSTTWSATKRKSWTTLTTSSGTGTSNVFWSRNATGLTAGTYVDTITVIAAGVATPGSVFDTLVVTSAPVPLTLAVAPGSRNVAVQLGGVAPTDQASVTLSGDNNVATPWSASKRKSWTTLTTANGTGSGSVAWSRNATGLAAGTYVDTIAVTAVGVAVPALVYDTLRVTVAPVSLTLAVAPGSRNVAVQLGGVAPNDQASVTLNGDNNVATSWNATRRKSWTILTTASGTGSGTVAWGRNVAGLAVGTYVDTITVTATGVATPSRLIDTLRITTAPTVPIVVAVTPGSRRVSITQGATAAQDSAEVTLTGTASGSTSWTATRSAGWATLTTASGTGNGRLRWTRTTSVLAIGTYVDTIRVTVGSASAVLFDTLLVAAAPQNIAVTPKGKKFRLLTAVGSSASVVESNLDSAIVAGSVPDGESNRWIATTNATRFRMVTQSGELNRTMLWERLPVTLQPGVHVDSITIRLERDPSVQSTFVDTLEIVAVPSPEPGIAVEELFRAGGLSVDQRSVFDRDGNGNGGYDIGDFLAWLDRTHVRLSPSVVSRLQDLMVRDAATQAEATRKRDR